MDALISFTHSQ